MNKNKEEAYIFPPDFLWGVSTSAHQTEGGMVNDWSEWEKSQLRITNYELRTGKRFDPDMFISGQACDSYNRYEEDFDLAKELNCGGFRLGIEWARIEPEEGNYKKEEIEHYRKVLESLKSRKIKTVVTLWHWTNPVWVARQGGWENKKTANDFIRFTELVVKELGGLIDFWVTLNEPMMIVGHGYLDGKFPPNHVADIFGSLKLFKNFVNAHKGAYGIIHKRIPLAKVGLAMTTGYFDVAHPGNPIEKIMVRIADYFRNFWLLDKIKGYYDYIGANYYHHDRLVWHPPFKKNENREISDFGWEIYPEGVYHVLKNYAKLGKPIYITENGVADADDDQRPKFIAEHLKYIHKAIKEGVLVRGYFHWSLLDNFEWADGWTQKFGLYEVDRKTFKRTPRPSARMYAEICGSNKLVMTNDE